MTALAWLLAAPAGALGALARHGVARLLSARLGAHAPWGVLAANLSGAFLLGVLVGAAAGDRLLLVLGAGFLGSYTTFSTWMVETDALAREGRYAGALVNLVAPTIGGLVLAAAGFAAGAGLA